MTIRYAVGLRRDIEQFLQMVSGQGTSGSIGSILGELVNDIHLEPVRDSLSGGIDENDSAIVRREIKVDSSAPEPPNPALLQYFMNVRRAGM